MGYLELDVDISSEAKAMHETARKFAVEHMRPTGIELDKLPDPKDVIAEGSRLWDLFKKHREVGLNKINMPKAFGGLQEEVEPIARILIYEELGYGDAGLCSSLAVSDMPFNFASMSPDPELNELARKYATDKEANLIGCWSIIEPDHGSDWILADQPGFEDPKIVPTLKAVLKGDEYIINGQKAAWVSNGSIATHALVHLNVDPSRGMQGIGIAVIPLDLPGISRGKPLNKMGQRALNQAEIFFEEVKLPCKYMLVPDPDMGTALTHLILGTANAVMGTVFAGLAQAAYDEALNYAKERVQGGVPIIEHQNIKLKLFKMFSMVESARALTRRVSLFNAANQAPSFPHSVAAKVLSTETAFHTASEAIQILGGNGLSREYVVEKMFRDARASMIEDGENNVLSISAASEL
jgi:alkylation response protein AidB-like acyl-CoA dehydrogenase